MQLTARNKDVYTFAQILKKQSHQKHDIVVPSSHLRMTDDGHFVIQDAPLPEGLAETLRSAGISTSEENRATLPYRALNVGHSSLVQKLPIPAFKRPYDFMHEDNPKLLARVVNNYLNEMNKNLLVRTFRPVDEESGERGILRAVLSDRYEVIDNFDIFMRALKSIRELGLSPNINASISERNMWVEFKLPDMGVKAADFVGDYRNPHPDGSPNNDDIDGNRFVYPGFLLRNSEVGAGAFEIKPRLVLQICSNGIVRSKDALRKVHLGAEMSSGVVDFGEEVRRKAMELADAQVKKAVETFASEEYLHDAISDIMGDGADIMLEHPKEALSNSASALGMTEDEENDLFDFFMRGGSQKRAAVPQAVTAMTQHMEDPDRAYELEGDAWDILPHMDNLDVAPEQSN